MKKIAAVFLPTLFLTIFLANLFLSTVQKGETSSDKNIKAYIKQALAKCKKKVSEDKNCWEYLIDETMDKKGLDVTLELIAAVYQSEPNFSQTCHALVHKVGEKAYELFDQKKDFKLSPKTAFCAYGFYHGFMETLTIKTKDLGRASAFCDYVDQQLASLTSDAKLQCYHGIGHGVAGVHDPKVRGSEQAILDPTLSICEQVSTTDDQLYRCSSGVFNAIAIFYASGEYDLPLNKNDPLKLCRAQPEKFKEPCYGNMNTVLAWIGGNDLKASARFVEDIGEDKQAVSAIRYLVALLSPNKQDQKDQLVSECRSFQKRLHTPCIQGIVHGLLEHGKPAEEFVAALSFCRLKILSKEEKDTCFKYALPYLNSIYAKEKVKDICVSVEEEYRQFCRV